MAPLGILAVLFSIGVFILVRWCLAATVIIAVTILAFSLWLQISEGKPHWFFLICSIVTFVYILFAGLTLSRSKGVGWTQLL